MFTARYGLIAYIKRFITVVESVYSAVRTVVESVYSAVRTDSLYKADYVWSLERLFNLSKVRCLMLTCEVYTTLAQILCKLHLSNKRRPAQSPCLQI